MKLKLNVLYAAVASTLIAASAGVFAQTTGPNSSATPYLTGIGGTTFTSILTVGDSPTGSTYKMVGIPDGLGAIDNGSSITVFMNHELGATAGVARAHGGTGAFVSTWTIQKSNLAVTAGADAFNQVFTPTGVAAGASYAASASTAYTQITTSFARYCSADLPAVSAFYNPTTGLGTQERIFMKGEESYTAGDTLQQGRATGMVATGSNAGKNYVLTALGNAAWENQVANPYAQDKTIVIGLSDGGGATSKSNGVNVYIGTKTNVGNEIERAGLTNGTSYRIAIGANLNETRAADAGLGLVNNQTTFSLVAASGATNGTSFLRPEDGAWDTKSNNKFYFVTTDQVDAAKSPGNANGAGVATSPSQVGRSRLWSMTFSDISNPNAGGTIEMLLDGTGPNQMFDNLTVDKDGNVIIQEDVGNATHLGKVWKYDTTTKSLSLIAQHDQSRFGNLGVAPTSPFTVDEESSGVIDVTDMLIGQAGYDTVNNRYYLLDVQAHYSQPGQLVEGGQLLLMTVPVPEPSTYAMMLAGLAGIGSIVRRRKKAAQA